MAMIPFNNLFDKNNICLYHKYSYGLNKKWKNYYFEINIEKGYNKENIYIINNGIYNKKKINMYNCFYENRFERDDIEQIKIEIDKNFIIRLKYLIENDEWSKYYYFIQKDIYKVNPDIKFEYKHIIYEKLLIINGEDN
jgi:hypothetical protein